MNVRSPKQVGVSIKNCDLGILGI